MEIRRSYDRLISTMRFPMLVRHLYIESGPWIAATMVLAMLVKIILGLAPFCQGVFWFGMNKNIMSAHYSDVIMIAKASQITSLTIVYTTVYSGADKRKHQSSASLAFVQGIHWWPVNSLHKRPVMWMMFPFPGSQHYQVNSRNGNGCAL